MTGIMNNRNENVKHKTKHLVLRKTGPAALYLTLTHYSAISNEIWPYHLHIRKLSDYPGHTMHPKDGFGCTTPRSAILS